MGPAPSLTTRLSFRPTPRRTLPHGSCAKPCAMTETPRSASSLAEIAGTAGFTDQSHFTRAFKRCTGMAPGQYRTFLAFKT
jgi:AraC-like DNA-binding protein